MIKLLMASLFILLAMLACTDGEDVEITLFAPASADDPVIKGDTIMRGEDGHCYLARFLQMSEVCSGNADMRLSRVDSQICIDKGL